MKITLISLKLTNFKGARQKTIEFFKPVTSIYGANKSGKTTVFDAFLWTLFDKDSSYRKTFEIKPLDENNEPYHKLDHEVSMAIDVDGTLINIRKSLREKWTKPRGSNEQVFEGHETSYFWNDVPLKLKEFQAKIAEIINEEQFKMISNPLYFNTVLDWNQRRATLLKIAGEISNDDVVATNTKLFAPLMQELAGKKSLEEFKKQLAAQKKIIKDELALIPSRIDEAKRSMPEEADYVALQKELDKLTAEIARIDNLLMNKTAAEKEYQEKVNANIKERQRYIAENNQIEFDAKETVKAKARSRVTVINEKTALLTESKNNLRAAEDSLNNNETKLAQLEQQKKEALEKYHSINGQQLVFADDQFCCPTCKRELDAETISSQKEELIKNFNEKKASRLNDNIAVGQKINEDISLLKTAIENNRQRIKLIQSDISSFEDSLSILKEENDRMSADESGEAEKSLAANAVYHDNKLQIEAITALINAPAPVANNSELLEQKSNINAQVKSIQKEIDTKEQREKIQARIVELEEQESKMANELSELEGKEYSIDQFNKTKMDTLEEKVNKMFSLVKFRMFKQQINGGFEDTCDAMVNGVPFSDVNTAGKIQAGLDIINVLQKAFGYAVPVFIDNRESVTEIPEMNTQVINLYVFKIDKTLRIEEGINEKAPKALAEALA